MDLQGAQPQDICLTTGPACLQADVLQCTGMLMPVPQRIPQSLRAHASPVCQKADVLQHASAETQSTFIADTCIPTPPPPPKKITRDTFCMNTVTA
jgi:hypothetical protein